MPLFEGERKQKIMQIFEENFLLSHYTAEEIKYKFISRFYVFGTKPFYTLSSAAISYFESIKKILEIFWSKTKLIFLWEFKANF
jgi:hypothetical protein